jgi:hypothetical protein
VQGEWLVCLCNTHAVIYFFTVLLLMNVSKGGRNVSEREPSQLASTTIFHKFLFPRPVFSFPFREKVSDGDDDGSGGCSNGKEK